MKEVRIECTKECLLGSVGGEYIGVDPDFNERTNALDDFSTVAAEGCEGLLGDRGRYIRFAPKGSALEQFRKQKVLLQKRVGRVPVGEHHLEDRIDIASTPSTATSVDRSHQALSGDDETP